MVVLESTFFSLDSIGHENEALINMFFDHVFVFSGFNGCHLVY